MGKHKMQPISHIFIGKIIVYEGVRYLFEVNTIFIPCDIVIRNPRLVGYPSVYSIATFFLIGCPMRYEFVIIDMASIPSL